MELATFSTTVGMSRLMGLPFAIKNSFMHFVDSDTESQEGECGRRSRSTPVERRCVNPYQDKALACGPSCAKSIEHETTTPCKELSCCSAGDTDSDLPSFSRQPTCDSLGRQLTCESLSSNMTWESMTFGEPTLESLEPMSRTLTLESLPPVSRQPTTESMRSLKLEMLGHQLTCDSLVEVAQAPLSPRSQAEEDIDTSGFTSVMLRNIPFPLTRDELTKLLDIEGFAGKYDFIYLPVHWAKSHNFGYVFINMVDNCAAEHLKDHFTNFQNWPVGMTCTEPSEVDWCIHFQGLEANVQRYRNSPVMHRALPDCLKPAIFKDGKRVGFPGPTKSIRVPRKRKTGAKARTD